MRSGFFILPALMAAGFTSSAFAGTIYVDDGIKIYDYSPTGVPSTFSTQPGTTAIGMAFNSSGTLYVAARDSNAVYVYSPSGVQSLFAAASDPYGLAVDSQGDVFTGNNFGGEIEEYSPAGVGTVFATGTGVQSLAFDPLNGELFEGDSSGNIYEYSTTGTRSTFASGVPNSIFGLAFDAAGDLFASDWNGEISKFTPGGSRSIFATFSTQTLPTSLAYDFASGNLYMTEVARGASNCCQQVVDVFSPAGTESVFATGLYVPFAIADLQAAPAVAATPEPGTFYLLGGGTLIALARVRRH